MYPHEIQAIPVRSVVGGEWEVGEKDHGSLANLGVVGVGPAVVGGGSSTAEQRWRSRMTNFGELRPAMQGRTWVVGVEKSFAGDGGGAERRRGRVRVRGPVLGYL